MPTPPRPSFTVSLGRIFEDKDFNIRIFYGDIDALAIQLMTEGQLEAIKVRKDDKNYYVTNGHRRRRAFIRAHDLRIEKAGDKWFVFEGKGDQERKLCEAPGPLHRNFIADQVLCQLEDKNASDVELFKNQLSYGSGKPYAALEKLLFIARLRKGMKMAKEDVILQTGLSRTYVNNAESLNSADARLLKMVSDDRISQKLALRLLRTCTAGEQMTKVEQAIRKATGKGRPDDKLLPKDFNWKEERASAPLGKANRRALGTDPVRQRLRGLMTRLKPQIARAPSKVAKERLELLGLIDRYLSGKSTYAELESFLLGRE